MRGLDVGRWEREYGRWDVFRNLDLKGCIWGKMGRLVRVSYSELVKLV